MSEPMATDASTVLNDNITRQQSRHAFTSQVFSEADRSGAERGSTPIDGITSSVMFSARSSSSSSASAESYYSVLSKKDEKMAAAMAADMAAAFRPAPESGDDYTNTTIFHSTREFDTKSNVTQIAANKGLAFEKVSNEGDTRSNTSDRPEDLPDTIAIPNLAPGEKLKPPTDFYYSTNIKSTKNHQPLDTLAMPGENESKAAKVSDLEVSLGASGIVDRSEYIDIESGDVAPIDKRPLGRFEVMASIERAAIIDAVKTHSLIQPLVNIAPKENPNIQRMMADITGAIDDVILSARKQVGEDGSVRYFDPEDPSNDLTELHASNEKIKSSFSKLSEDLSTLVDSKAAFMNYKARQSTGTATLTDSVQRNIFGNELHAVIARSLLQSLLVTGGTAAIQVGTVSMLKSFFSAHPEQIPEPVLKEVRAELGQDATDKAVMSAAISKLSVPGSTYLDENTNSEEVIYGSEAGVGFLRGILIPMADNANEADARAAKVQKSINSAHTPTAPQTAKERAISSMQSSFPTQLKWNVASGALASMVSTAAAGETTGLNIMIEVAKTMGFSVLGAATNAGADGFRSAVYTGKNEAVTQTIKAAARIAGRGIAQGLKTGISYAQSANSPAKAITISAPSISTNAPTSAPTSARTRAPTRAPTNAPTRAPTTHAPTGQSTAAPTNAVNTRALNEQSTTMASALSFRSPTADAIRGTSQFLLGGILKEGLGAAFQNYTTKNVPPNETAVLVMAKAIGTVAEFGRDLNGVTAPLISSSGQESLQDLSYLVQRTLNEVLDANSTDFETMDFDAHYRNYMADLKTVELNMVDQKDTAGSSAKA
jgi:hypothetical protein